MKLWDTARRAEGSQGPNESEDAFCVAEPKLAEKQVLHIDFVDMAQRSEATSKLRVLLAELQAEAGSVKLRQ